MSTVAESSKYGQGMVSFGARSESFDDIRSTYPRQGIAEANVITVAAHGYPAFFLAEGASEVWSFDMCPGTVTWNRFLRHATASLDYDAGLALFGFGTTDREKEIKSTERPPTNAVFEHALSDFQAPENDREYVRETFDRLRVSPFMRAFSDDFRSEGDNRFYSTEERYTSVANAALDGRWHIQLAEIQPYLEQRVETEGDQFDFAFLSNIRQWVQSSTRPDERDHSGSLVHEIERERLHAALSNTLSRLIRPGGSIYEAQVGKLTHTYIEPLHLTPSEEWETSLRRIYFGGELDPQDFRTASLPKVFHYMRQ